MEIDYEDEVHDETNSQQNHSQMNNSRSRWFNKGANALPPINSGIAVVNRLRDQDSLFKHSDYLIEKKSAVYHEYCDIRSGEDAIAFFSRNGLNNPIKFVLCEKKYNEYISPQIWENRPYDLVVPPNGLEEKYKPYGDYFVINMNGIITYKKDETKKDKYFTEFLTLAEWMRQSTMFDYLAEINYFKNYLLRKILISIHNKIRRKMYLLKRRTLMNRLFLTKPCYSSTLMEIKSKIYSFEMNNIFNYKVDSSENEFRIDAFIDKVEKTYLHELIHQWEQSMIIQIRNILVELCKVVKRRTTKEEDDSGAKNSKTKPLIHIHQEENLKKIVNIFALEDNKMLLDFLKLIQNMLRGRIYEGFLEMFRTFVNEIDNQILDKRDSSNPNSRFFKITLSFEEQSMSFDPNWHEFKHKLKTLVEHSCMDTLDKFKKLLESSISVDFNSYVDLSDYDIDKFNSISKIFTKDQRFNKSLVTLYTSIENNWDEGEKGQDALKDFEDMLEIYTNVMNFDVEAFTTVSAIQHDTMQTEQDNQRCDTKCEIVSKVVKEMAKHEEFKNKLRNLQRRKVGILDFNMSEANDKVSYKLDEFYKVLKHSIKEFKDDLTTYLGQNISDSKEMFKELKNKKWPEENDEYTADLLRDWFNTYKKIQAYNKPGDPRNKLNYLNQIKKVLEESQMHDKESLSQSGTHSSMMKNLTKEIEDVEKVLFEHKHHIEYRLDQEIMGYETKVRDINIELITDHGDSKSSLEDFKIKLYKEKYAKYLAEVSSTKDYFCDYKELLGNPINNPEYELKLILEFETKANILLRFYADLEEYLKYEKTMYQDQPINFLSKVANYDYVKNVDYDYEAYYTYISRLQTKCKDEYKKKLKLDVVNTFIKRVNNVTTVELPILEVLSTVQLRKSHFIQVAESLKYTFTEDSIFFKPLLENDLSSQKSKLMDIYEKASNQMKLREKGEYYLKKWKNYSLSFDETPMFTDLDSVVNELRIDIEKMKDEILTDIEREIIAEEINTLLDELTHYVSQVEELATFQELWFTCFTYFEDSEVQVIFKEENKKFRDVDRFIKKIISHSQELQYLRKVLDKMNKSDKKQKNTDIEQIKLFMQSLEEWNGKIQSWLEEQRQKAVDKKLYQFKLQQAAPENNPQIVYVCTLLAEAELDERAYEGGDVYSESADDLFYEKKAILDEKLNELGIFNSHLKVWYYDEFNPALTPPEGKCQKNEKISRESHDIWQIGILFVDLMTNGLIQQVNKMIESKAEETGSDWHPHKLYLDIANHSESLMYITDLYDEYLVDNFPELEDTIISNKNILAKLSRIKGKINILLRNTINKEKYERFSIQELINCGYVKQFWDAEEENIMFD